MDATRYAIVREVARGRMGRIVEAWDERYRRRVAIKMLLQVGPAAERSFAREARITGSLQHPAIVPMHEAGRWTTGEPFFVMKLVAGKPLSKVLAEKRTLPEKLALVPHVIAATEALAYAHAERVVHRDLTPSNVLVGEFGETYVIDWGLARRRAEGEAGEDVDERADVYALGAILYDVLAGHTPRATGGVASAERAVSTPRDPLASIAPGVPRDLVTIVEKAMAHDPAARFASAREMAVELTRFSTGQLVAAHSYSLPSLVARFARRYRALVAMAAVLFLALGATAAISLARILRERNRAAAATVEAERQRAVAVAESNASERLVAFAIGDLTERLESLGKLDLLAGMGSEVLDYYGSVRPVQDEPDVGVLERRGSALASLASVESQKRDFAQAEALQRSAIAAYAAARGRDPHDAEARARHVTLTAGMAVLLDNASEYERGKEALARAEEVLRALDDGGPSDAREWVALAYASAASASGRSRRGDAEIARALFARAKESMARAGEIGALPPAWQDVAARAWMNLCATATSLGDAAAVVLACTGAVDAREQELVRDPDHIGHLAELAHALFGRGVAQLAAGAKADAERSLRESAAIGQRVLDREPNNFLAAYYRGSALHTVCDVELAQGRAADALADCNAATATLRALSEQRADDTMAEAALGRALRGAASAYRLLGRLDDAESNAEAALAQFQKVAARSPDSDIRKSDLSGGYRDLGDVLAALERYGEARAAYRQGIDLDEKRLEERPSATQFEWHAGDIWIRLGNVEREANRIALAHEAYEHALAHFERATKSDPNEFSSAFGLAKANARLSSVEGDPAKRAALRERARELAASLDAAGKLSEGQRRSLAP